MTRSLRLPGVAGVLVAEQDDFLFTSDRGAARVSIFRCSDERLLGRVEVGPHPNGLAYDDRLRRLYAFNLGEPLGENCTVSVIDLEAMQVVQELALPGRPRWAVYDDERDCVYANILEPGVIAVIDCERGQMARGPAVSVTFLSDSCSSLDGSPGSGSMVACTPGPPSRDLRSCSGSSRSTCSCSISPSARAVMAGAACE